MSDTLECPYEPILNRVIVEECTDIHFVTPHIIAPTTNKVREYIKGKVVAVGPGAIDDNNRRIPSQAKVGDMIVFNKLGKIAIDQYYALCELDILALVKKNSDNGCPFKPTLNRVILENYGVEKTTKSGLIKGENNKAYAVMKVKEVGIGLPTSKGLTISSQMKEGDVVFIDLRHSGWMHFFGYMLANESCVVMVDRSAK